MADPGTQKHWDWLSRSNIFYRQYEHSEIGHAIHHDVFGGRHQGEVTSYASAGHKHVYPAEYGEEYHFHGYQKERKNDNAGHRQARLKLKELFHFALTAAAFLVFASFTIAAIMCLMEPPKTAEPDYLLVPTTTGTGHAPKLDAEILEPQRRERAFTSDPVSLEILNDMCLRFLSSIEALAISQEDGGQCLGKTLCRNNNYSKSLKGTQKLWLPVWSFGLNWIGERLSNGQNSTKRMNTLEYLKATVTGLGSSERNELYSKCDAQRGRKRKARE